MLRLQNSEILWDDSVPDATEERGLRLPDQPWLFFHVAGGARPMSPV